jgi:hypothetical protein
MSQYAQGATTLVGAPLVRQSSALPCQHDGTTPCGACLAAELVAASDVIDQAEARARAAWADGYAAAQRLTREAAEAEGYARAIADVKAAQHGVAGVLRELADGEAARWHLCCPACRRDGHRAGCRDCEARSRETFAAPMPGDYPGRPV